MIFTYIAFRGKILHSRAWLIYVQDVERYLFEALRHCDSAGGGDPL